MPRTVIGLVGGIASGKSTVAKLLSAARPVTHVDADAVAGRIFRRTRVREAIARRIQGVLGADGIMDRKKLAEMVFSQPRDLAALEEILHPPIRREIERRIAGARTPYVLVDAALLQETGADALCDPVVYVACPAKTRRDRARTGRGWSEEEYRARERAQWSCRRKRARADLVVDNSDGLERTRREVDHLLESIERRS